VLYPNLVDKESGYILALMDPNVFPTYLRGFMLAAFAAAYMSTIGTQLNWGASYVINDFYRRFVATDKRERHYVIASQVVTMLIMVISLVITFYLQSIGNAWKLLLVTGAGTGTVLLLRWFWWRINAWSEISAMVIAAIVSLVLQLRFRMDSNRPRDFAYLMLITVGITTVVWLAVTLLTKPEPSEKLISFYQKVRPEGPGWKRVAAEAGEQRQAGHGLWVQIANWVLGCVLIYSSLFGIGKLVMKEWLPAVAFIAAAIVSGILIWRNLSQTDWREPTTE
jgi:Na+/proline symporter